MARVRVGLKTPDSSFESIRFGHGPTRVEFEFRVRVGLEFRVGLAPLKLDLKLEIF